MTLPDWLTLARETLDEAISVESTKQRQAAAIEAQTELDARLDDLIALEVAVQTGRNSGWLGAVPDNHGAGPAVGALVSKGPQRAEVSRLQTSLPSSSTKPGER